MRIESGSSLISDDSTVGLSTGLGDSGGVAGVGYTFGFASELLEIADLVIRDAEDPEESFVAGPVELTM